MELLLIVGSTTVISLLSLVGLSILIIKEKLLRKILLFLVAFSAGSLVGASFLHLLPEAVEKSVATEIFTSVLIGYVFLYFLEKFLLWHHCHKVEHVHTLGYASLISDSIHNFLDGLIIAASFMTSFKLGIISSLAVVFHEIPQEIGDFGVLLYSKFKKRKALALNFLSALAALLGGLVGFFIYPYSEKFATLLLPFAAGNFIYISSSDMIPEIKKIENLKNSFILFLIFVLGIFVMAIPKIFLT